MYIYIYTYASQCYSGYGVTIGLFPLYNTSLFGTGVGRPQTIRMLFRLRLCLSTGCLLAVMLCLFSGMMGASVFICIYTFMHICMYICNYYIHAYSYTYMCMYVYTYLYTCVHMYVRIYVYIYVHIYTYI